MLAYLLPARPTTLDDAVGHLQRRGKSTAPQADERPSLMLVRHIIFDLPSGQVSFEAHEVEVLRDAAASRAGSSTAARDLSLLLDRALVAPRPVAFRRAELQTLIEIATSADLTEVADRLETAGSGTTG